MLGIYNEGLLQQVGTAMLDQLTVTGLKSKVVTFTNLCYYTVRVSFEYISRRCPMDRNLYDQIVSEYRKTGSVDLTARACGTYPIKVRKVLITEGLWHSKKSDAVNALRNRGYSVPEIADELQMDEKNVQYYLPYTDSALSGEKKDGARRTEAFREKSRKAAEGSMEKKKTGKRSTEKNTGSFGNPEIDNGPNIPETVAGRRGWSGYLLHLELVENMYSEEDEDCCGIFEGVKDADVLRGLIKAKEGISRDVVVSGNMTLHQLGYAIQEAFGFHNEHLHHYALPKKRSLPAECLRPHRTPSPPQSRMHNDYMNSYRRPRKTRPV